MHITTLTKQPKKVLIKSRNKFRYKILILSLQTLKKKTMFFQLKITIKDVNGKDHPVFTCDILEGFPYNGKEKDTFLTNEWVDAAVSSIKAIKNEVGIEKIETVA